MSMVSGGSSHNSRSNASLVGSSAHNNRSNRSMASSNSHNNRSNRSMHSIAEDYAAIATPVVFEEHRDVSTTSIEDDVAENVDDMLSEDDSDLESERNSNTPRRNNSVPQSQWAKYRSSLHVQVPIVVSIALGAYFGVGIRVLLTEFAKALSTSQAELLELLGFSYFLPNAVGCFVMGFAVRWKPLLRDQFAVYFSGIMTGFCGCCTTFASWDLGVAAMFVHGRWLNAFLMLFIQMASAISSFRCGYHAGEGLVQYFTVSLYKFRKPPVDMNQLKLDLERYISCMRSVKANVFGQLVSRRVRATEQALVISRDACTELISEIAQVEQDFHRVQHNAMQWALTGAFVTVWLWVVPFVGFSNYANSRLLALCFGPFGALLRYYLSLNNSKPKWKHFPFYTFLPNVVASILSCVLEVIGSSIAADHDAGSDAFKAYILFGEGAIRVGFLGSLSTVSTWVNELDGLSSRRFYWAYRYAFGSVVVSQLASIFVLGMYQAYGNGPLLI